LNFLGSYSSALKVATGKVCAVTGDLWSEDLKKKPQNYLPLPEQPWLDGYAIEKGIIRQFVAAPVGKGMTVEEQVTGESNWQGIQLKAFPVKAGYYWRTELEGTIRNAWRLAVEMKSERFREECSVFDGEMAGATYACMEAGDLGLAPGGRMRQEIYEDERSLKHYNIKAAARCFVHLSNAENWQELTGEPAPETPISARSYMNAGLPWYEYESAEKSLKGSKKLSKTHSIKDVLKGQ
jgi:hypothetical protein